MGQPNRMRNVFRGVTVAVAMGVSVAVASPTSPTVTGLDTANRVNAPLENKRNSYTPAVGGI